MWALPDVRHEPRQVRLLSVSSDTAWPIGEAVEALCDLGCSPVPGEGCSCGIYGARSLALALEVLSQAGGPFFAVGKVSLWGRVIPGEYGYRAQWAYPASICFIDKPWLQPAAIGAITDGLGAYAVPFDIARFSDVQRRSLLP